MNCEHKYIAKYESRFCILIPIYYADEIRPAWRKYGIFGTLEEAKEAYAGAPDYLKANEEENRENRRYKRAEMLLLYEHGKTIKAEAIKRQYHF